MKEIYCDGACSGNPGPGGWGVWLKKDGKDIEIYGHQSKTTNNQMELKAAIVAVQFINSEDVTNIYTDSNYVINGITKWIIGWKKNNWQSAKKEPVKNTELWKELDKLSQKKKINWLWVRGHSGDIGNEMADALAKMGSKGKSNEHLLNELIGNNSQPSISEIKTKSKCFDLNTIIVNSKKEQFIVLENTGLIFPNIRSYKIKSIINPQLMIYINFEQAHQEYDVYKSIDNYSNTLNILKKTLNKNKEIYYAFKEKCVHVIASSQESAACTICGADFGWYCEDSPDHICYYYTNEGQIELKSGVKIEPPQDHNINNESDDWCIFCGNPNERK